MKITERYILTTFKATALASILFWILMLGPKDDSEYLIFLPVSVIVLFLICLGMISGTIVPIYWIEKNNLTNPQIFRKYFPYYAILFFAFCCFLFIKFNFDFMLLKLISIAFITAMQTWIWFFKPKTSF